MLVGVQRLSVSKTLRSLDIVAFASGVQKDFVELFFVHP
jgi:hypothetical protein